MTARHKGGEDEEEDAVRYAVALREGEDTASGMGKNWFAFCRELVLEGLWTCLETDF